MCGGAFHRKSSSSCCFVPLPCCSLRRIRVIRQKPESGSRRPSSEHRCSHSRRAVFSLTFQTLAFIPLTRPPRVEHISQPPPKQSFPLPLPVPSKASGERVEPRDWRCYHQWGGATEGCLLVNKAFCSGAIISSDPSFRELPLNQLVPV